MPEQTADEPMAQTADELQRLFTDHGLRCTRQRQAIYQTLGRMADHPTADELYRRVGPTLDGLSLATVYNTLEALCEAKLVRKLPGLGKGSARYDATAEPHLHIRDQRTGEVADLPDHLSAQIVNRISQTTLRRVESELGFRVDNLQIELVGQYETGQTKQV